MSVEFKVFETLNFERQTSNTEHRTSNLELRTSNIDPDNYRDRTS
jgi:hypothetical protein